MRVGQRLFLAVIPAILGVLAVAALAYWGELGRQVPASLVLIAIIAALGSLVLAWYNTRYVAHRIEDLARTRVSRASARLATVSNDDTAGHPVRSDELDEIEEAVERLGHELRGQLTAERARAAGAEAKRTEYAGLLDEALTVLTNRLRDTQLPLHILLSSPFGSLNENQEEMLGAAQQATDAADVELRQIRKLLELDRGKLVVVPQRIGVAAFLRPVIAVATARLASGRGQLVAEVPDTLPRLIVDPVLAQDALSALAVSAATAIPEGGNLELHAEEGGAGIVRLRLTPSSITGSPSLEIRLASRTLAALGITVAPDGNGLVIDFPCESV